MTSPNHEPRPGEPASRVPPVGRDLAIAALRVGESRYARFAGAAPDREREAALARSLGELGQLVPVLVHEHGGELHLLDGFARARAAGALGWKELACAVVTEPPFEQVLSLLVAVRRDLLATSAVARTLLVALAARDGLSSERLCDWLLPALGLQGHRRVLRRCVAIAEMPSPVLEFCAAKGFSLKQCAHLSHHGPELLEQVFSWRDRIALTAALAEELLEDLGDIVRATGRSTAEVAARPEIHAVLESGEPPQRAARLLRDRLRELSAPILTGANQRMDRVVESLAPPPRVELRWDRSLERRELDLRISLRDPEELGERLVWLRRAEVERGVAALFEEL